MVCYVNLGTVKITKEARDILKIMGNNIASFNTGHNLVVKTVDLPERFHQLFVENVNHSLNVTLLSLQEEVRLALAESVRTTIAITQFNEVGKDTHCNVTLVVVDYRSDLNVPSTVSGNKFHVHETRTNTTSSLTLTIYQKIRGEEDVALVIELEVSEDSFKLLTKCCLGFRGIRRHVVSRHTTNRDTCEFTFNSDCLNTLDIREERIRLISIA